MLFPAPGDHYILGKLRAELLPWLIGGLNCRRRWFVWLARIHGYVEAIIAALLGLGVAPRAIDLFRGKIEDGSTAISVLGDFLPGVWAWVALCAVIVWAVLKIVVRQENVLQRALFAEACYQEMRKLNLQLEEVLAKPEPMPALKGIIDATLGQTKWAMDKNVWPWNDKAALEREFRIQLDQRTAAIRQEFMARWAPPPPGGTQ